MFPAASTWETAKVWTPSDSAPVEKPELHDVEVPLRSQVKVKPASPVKVKRWLDALEDGRLEVITTGGAVASTVQL